MGIADGVEGRIEGVPWQRLAIEARDPTAPLASDLETTSSSTSDAGDFTLSGRVRLSGAQGPVATALQIGVRLPNAGNESGLGRDVTDALASLVGGWRRGGMRIVGEAGFAILGSPTHRAAQNDQGRLGLLIEVEPRGRPFTLGAETRRSFGDEGPGNDLATDLAAGGRIRLGDLVADLAYRRTWSEGRGTNAIQAGIARTF